MTDATVLHLPTKPTLGNVEAEAALLGGMMLANKQIDRIADKLKPEDFLEPVHGRIFSAILREYSLGNVASGVTLRPYFADDPAMAEIGGSGYLAKLTGSGASIFGLVSFADQIAELARKRRMVDRFQDIIQSAYDYKQTSSQLAADAEGAIAEALDEGEGQTELTAGECITAALEAIERNDPGIVSRIASFDLAAGPIRKGNLCILAGRPGMGKTALALCYAKEAARTGKGVLFVSLEMTAEELGERIVADETYRDDQEAVSYDAIVNGSVSTSQFRQLCRAREMIAGLPLQVVDVGSLKVGGLASLVRRWKRRFATRGQSLDLIVVDYLQLLAPDYRVSGPYEAVTIISKALKTIAKANDVGVMALAQLSRQVEARTPPKPMLSDLRDSGQIEQDADIVLFLYREEYYLRQNEPMPQHKDRLTWETKMDDCRGAIDFICAKRRKGWVRTTQGRFFGAYQAVRD